MYSIGWDKQVIEIEPRGLAMFGYGQWQHRAYKKRTDLFARSICISAHPDQAWLMICCVDLGCITSAIRLAVIEKLQEEFKENFDPQHLVLTATHTHSGPGGCSFEALYNMPTQGFIPDHIEAITHAIVSAIKTSIRTAQATEIMLTQDDFSPDVEVAWNRSLSAYNLNPDVNPLKYDQTHLALDRKMHILGFYREDKLHAVMSLFGVHATCLSNQLDAHDGDNKGYAASDVEERLKKQGIAHPVAIFAQGTAGDVSPHYHGPQQLKKRKKIKGENEYLYAKQNGLRQSQLALNALQLEKNTLTGSLDAVLSYVDFSQIHVDAEFANGNQHAYTAPPCLGAAFFAGTPVDGLGAAKPIILSMSIVSDYVRKQRLKKKQPYDIALYQAQGKKKIIIESDRKLLLGKALNCVPNHIDPLITEMNRQMKKGAIQRSAMVPQVLPIQLIKIGPLLLVCCPGEITTIAGKRLKQTIKDYIKNDSIEVWLCSYCNDYMGYITTYEEYQQQNYEGGHTLYGQWTLAAFQTQFKKLVQNLNQPLQHRKYNQQLQPIQPPVDELALRTYQPKL